MTFLALFPDNIRLSAGSGSSVGYFWITEEHTAGHLLFAQLQPLFEKCALVYHAHHIAAVESAGPFGDRHIFDVGGCQPAA